MLIMRAALNEDGMFCLAFAEHLNYETSEKVFGFLQKTMKESKNFLLLNEDYKSFKLIQCFLEKVFSPTDLSGSISSTER